MFWFIMKILLVQFIQLPLAAGLYASTRTKFLHMVIKLVI